MKASEIIQPILEKREQAQAEAPSAVNAGGKAVPNRPLKGKKRKPYAGPVMALVELPRRQMLIDTEQTTKK